MGSAKTVKFGLPFGDIFLSLPPLSILVYAHDADVPSGLTAAGSLAERRPWSSEPLQNDPREEGIQALRAVYLLLGQEEGEEANGVPSMHSSIGKGGTGRREPRGGATPLSPVAVFLLSRAFGGHKGAVYAADKVNVSVWVGRIRQS